MNEARIFEDLERRVKDSGLECVHVEGIGEGQRGDTLRILLPVTQDGDPVIMELMLLEYEERSDLLYFYATIAVDVADEVRPALLETLLEWNTHCSLGAYGLYEEDGARQLYHKYSILLPRDAGPVAVADAAVRHLSVLQDVLGEQFPAFKELLGEE